MKKQNTEISIQLSLHYLDWNNKPRKNFPNKSDLQNQNKIKNTAEIQEFINIFTTPEFNKLHCFNRNFSNKPSQILAMLNTLVADNPAEIVNIVISFAEKNTPKGVDKNKFLVEKTQNLLLNQTKLRSVLKHY